MKKYLVIYEIEKIKGSEIIKINGSYTEEDFLQGLKNLIRVRDKRVIPKDTVITGIIDVTKILKDLEADNE